MINITRDIKQLKKFMSDEEVKLYVKSNLLDVLHQIDCISFEAWWKASETIESEKIELRDHHIRSKTGVI